MPERQRVQRRSQEMQSIQDKRMNLQKESTAAQEKMRKIRRKSVGKRSAFVCCRTKSIRTEWQMRKWKLNFRGCRQEKKEEVAIRRKQAIPAWRLGANQMEERVQFRGGCQEEKKEEATVKMNKSKAEPVSSWCYQRQAGSMKALQRAVWSLIVFGVCMAWREPEIQAQKMNEKDLYPTNSQSRRPKEEDAFLGDL